MFIHSFSDAFMYTETVRTIRDGELRTVTSTFTRLLSSEKSFVKHNSFHTQTDRDCVHIFDAVAFDNRETSGQIILLLSCC